MDFNPVNFYDKIGKKYTGGQITYPTYSKINIDLPMRMLIVGTSGSGKTNTLLSIIKQMNCFDKFYFFIKNPDQPLYRYLFDLLDKVAIKSNVSSSAVYQVYEDMENIPDIKEMGDKSFNTLVIFDDMQEVDNKELKKAQNIFIRGRTLNISCVWIGQNYISTPTVIRRNCDYVILKRLSPISELNLFIQRYGGDQKDKIIKLYDKMLKNPTNFIMFDTKTTKDNLRVRWNYGL